MVVYKKLVYVKFKKLKKYQKHIVRLSLKSNVTEGKRIDSTYILHLMFVNSQKMFSISLELVMSRCISFTISEIKVEILHIPFSVWLWSVAFKTENPPMSYLNVRQHHFQREDTGDIERA